MFKLFAIINMNMTDNTMDRNIDSNFVCSNLIIA